ncbi:MAG: type II secretion system protein [Candidatus Moraniibacteriota bacterium]
MLSRKSRRGFTLIELLTVIAIIGILSSIVMVSLTEARTRARTAKSLTSLEQIRTSLEAYYIFSGSYPVSNSWQGYCSAWGGSLGANWIPELQTYFPNGLPTDPRQLPNAPCFNNQTQFIYASNGADYKLISQNAESIVGVRQNLIDPMRPSVSFGYWSPGALGW